MSYRYYLWTNDGPRREVTKAEYVAAERAAGFYNTLGQPDEPATGAFSNGCSSGEEVWASNNAPNP